MELLKQTPDKYYELSIVDPPYGLDDKLYRSSYGKNSGGALALYAKDRWDIAPNKNYFDELKRVSKNQIVWGGNYFTDLLPVNRCWICWNKDNPATNFSSVEFAWTSFDLLPNYFYYAWGGLSDGIKGRNKKEKSIHPTQKPVALYRWLLHNYAKPGDRILDTHGGSRSLAIACHQMGFDHVSCELDKDYHEASVKRFKEQTKQLSLL
jgi:site-specific DNA-methyltransferase (adenine-specific)